MFHSLNGSEFQIESVYNTDNVDAYSKNSTGYNSIYISGLGSSNSFSPITNARQYINGAGLEKRAILAYAFLVENINEKLALSGDYQIKLFAFSRGASTARMLANYLSLYGLSISNINSRDSLGYTKFEGTFFEPKHSTSVRGLMTRINFLGLFDTVASIGVDPNNRLSPIQNYTNTEPLSKLSLDVPDIVEKCSHAVAINEIRTAYVYTPINITSNRKEVFFIGSHEDIGGKNNERQKIALRWMILESNMSNELHSLLISHFESLEIGNQAKIVDKSDVAPIYGGATNRFVDLSRVDKTVVEFANNHNITLQTVTDSILMQSLAGQIGAG